MRQTLSGCLDRMGLRRWSTRLSKSAGRNLRKGTNLVAVLAIVTGTVTLAAWPAPTRASYMNVLANGGFEEGFSSQGGCGMVGSGWQCFTNGGAANYGFYDDQWDRTVAEGSHSQLIEINTKGMMVGDADRYAGIYQTVAVVDWAEYNLSLAGLIRTTNLEGDPWRYRVQVGWTWGPQPDWGAVTNWTDTGWDKYSERTNPGSFLSFSKNLMAESNYLTVYLRVWKKWGVPNEELDVNFDAISLTGPSPYYYQPPVATPYYPPAPVRSRWPWRCRPPGLAVSGRAAGRWWSMPQPLPQPLPPSGCGVPYDCRPPVDTSVCLGPELVYNGSFESGFNPVAVGQVGNSWGYFTNGGGANYGFYDDQWPPVKADGNHSQLIEINTKNLYPVDNDRYAGIYQYLSGLLPGATYEFSMQGLLRGEGNEDDPYRFAAQMGWTPGYQADWAKVTNWTELNLGPIGKRTNPGPVTEYKVKFVASAPDMTLFIRGWKKWGIPNVEMDFNIDAVSVKGCGVGPHAVHAGGVAPVAAGCVGPCGGPVVDVLYPVAASGPRAMVIDVPAVDSGYGYDVPRWTQATATTSASGSRLRLRPAPVDAGYGYAPAPVAPGYDACTYVVQPGDSLSWIAKVNGTTVRELQAINGLANPNFIYVGQVLTLPGCGGPVPLPPGCVEPCGGPVVEPLPLPQPLPGGCVDPCGAPAPGTYTVQPGDTLSGIAARFGVDFHALCQVNGIRNPNLIYVGQVLILP